jgi:signal transduction histidine kinase
VIRRHGGQISASGRLGAGATFHFTLGQPSEGS